MAFGYALNRMNFSEKNKKNIGKCSIEIYCKCDKSFGFYGINFLIAFKTGFDISNIPQKHSNNLVNFALFMSKL